jgi:glyoxylase-like metal-dependent hydrolase (beta-lactamase superfamily II)
MHFKRWAALLIALVSANAVAAAKLPAFPEDPQAHTWEKVAEGIYAYISPPGITPLVSGNSLIVIGDDSVLVVDTGQFPSVARAEIAKIRQLTALPVRYIVTTHWHPDHWTGNGDFARAYPGVSIIATANTQTLAQTHGAQYVSPEYAGKILDSVDKAIARGTHSDGKPLLPSELPYLEMAKIQFQGFGKELVSAKLLYPNVVFSDSMDVYLDRRLVQIRFFGRGNTGGDAVVFVPDAKVLATGDLVVNPFPYGTGSFYSEWLSTLQKLLGLDAQIIVPGHGAVEHDNSYVRRLVQLLESLQTQVAAAVNAGLSLEDTQKRVTLADAMQEFCGGREFEDLCRNSFKNNFVGPAVARSYQEQKSGPLRSED